MKELVSALFLRARSQVATYSKLVSGTVKGMTHASGPQEALKSIARQTVVDSSIFDILGAINHEKLVCRLSDWCFYTGEDAVDPEWPSAQ